MNLHHLPETVDGRAAGAAGASACASATRARARSWARAAGRGRCESSSATSRSFSSTATCSSTSTCAGSWPCTAPRARGRRWRCGRTRSPTPTRRWSAIGRGGSSRSRGGRPRRAAPFRCSRASTCWTRPSSTGCPRAPPTACSTSTSRCWPRARTCRACPRGARGTISAAPRCTATRSFGCCRAAAAIASWWTGRRGWARPRACAGRWSGPAPASRAARGSSAACCGTGRWSRRARASRARSS